MEAMLAEEMSGSEEGSSGEDEEGQLNVQDIGSGPYATLHVQGPQTSAGSTDHPEGCMPCTFYCFTRRGCNRGLECRFCHLTHQSKLQQRREAWKKQQREKRKAIRERVTAEALGHRPQTIGNKMSLVVAAHTSSRCILNADGGRSNGLTGSTPRRGAPESLSALEVFAYSPGQALLTIGQDAEFQPQIAMAAAQFRLMAPLPKGLTLDSVSGIICGAPSAAVPQMTLVVEADLISGSTARATLELEVVDFTRGGFVIGHMSEYEPGKFMLLLYVPDDVEGKDKEQQVNTTGTGSFLIPRTANVSEQQVCQQHVGGGPLCAIPSRSGDRTISYSSHTAWQQYQRRGSRHVADRESALHMSGGHAGTGSARVCDEIGEAQTSASALEWW